MAAAPSMAAGGSSSSLSLQSSGSAADLSMPAGVLPGVLGSLPGGDEVRVAVTCGGLVGWMLVPKMRIMINLGAGQTAEVSPTQFERMGGRGNTKRWRATIRLMHGNLEIGKWLRKHGYDTRGPPVSSGSDAAPAGEHWLPRSNSGISTGASPGLPPQQWAPLEGSPMQMAAAWHAQGPYQHRAQLHLPLRSSSQQLLQQQEEQDQDEEPDDQGCDDFWAECPTMMAAQVQQQQQQPQQQYGPVDGGYQHHHQHQLLQRRGSVLAGPLQAVTVAAERHHQNRYHHHQQQQQEHYPQVVSYHQPQHNQGSPWQSTSAVSPAGPTGPYRTPAPQVLSQLRRHHQQQQPQQQQRQQPAAAAAPLQRLPGDGSEAVAAMADHLAGLAPLPPPHMLPFSRAPTAGGRPLDIRALFHAVVARGGFQAVSLRQGAWGEVLEALGLRSAAAAAGPAAGEADREAAVCAEVGGVYLELLLRFERMYDTEAWLQLTGRPSPVLGVPGSSCTPSPGAADHLLAGISAPLRSPPQANRAGAAAAGAAAAAGGSPGAALSASGAAAVVPAAGAGAGWPDGFGAELAPPAKRARTARGCVQRNSAQPASGGPGGAVGPVRPGAGAPASLEAPGNQWEDALGDIGDLDALLDECGFDLPPGTAALTAALAAAEGW